MPKVNTTTTVTTTTVKTTVRFDIEKFLEIVANLTYDYYTNLTDQLNATLRKMNVPTCPGPTTPFDYFAVNSTHRGRCYVCGLTTLGIPRDADCSDAFASNLVPMPPINPKSKARLKEYKKHCMFKDVFNYELNSTYPRSVFGRFTGGCSVRWTDVSGVYTQRSCRSKVRAITGLHYASERMARLEMALNDEDDGCIISPMASLTPLSRSISLYARIHACVCTGELCNAASLNDPAANMAAILLLWIVKLINN